MHVHTLPPYIHITKVFPISITDILTIPLVLVVLPEDRVEEVSNSTLEEEALPTSVVSTPYLSEIKVLLHDFSFLAEFK